MTTLKKKYLLFSLVSLSLPAICGIHREAGNKSTFCYRSLLILMICLLFWTVQVIKYTYLHSIRRRTKAIDCWLDGGTGWDKTKTIAVESHCRNVTRVAAANLSRDSRRAGLPPGGSTPCQEDRGKPLDAGSSGLIGMEILWGIVCPIVVFKRILWWW